MSREYSREIVAKHNKEDDLWIIHGDEVYDVTHFAEDHPGGKELLVENAGMDISGKLDVEHKHSQHARNILEEYKIGKLSGVNSVVKLEHKFQKSQSTDPSSPATNQDELNDVMKARKDDNFINLRKPLMEQVWNSNWSQAYYVEQVHIPRYTATSPTFFASPLLEAFTKNTWQGVLLVWIPVVIVSIFYALHSHGAGWTAHLFLDGLVLWTLYEYVFHRFLFHMDEHLPGNKVAITMHFLMHGVHHFLPMDRYRLVMPPVMMAGLSSLVWAVWITFTNVPTAAALMAGSYTGYIIYDMLHYYFHHGRIVKGYLQRMKTYHMDHHYVDPNLGYGVSNLVWDAVFNTMLPIRSS